MLLEKNTVFFLSTLMKNSFQLDLFDMAAQQLLWEDGKHKKKNCIGRAWIGAAGTADITQAFNLHEWKHMQNRENWCCFDIKGLVTCEHHLKSSAG